MAELVAPDTRLHAHWSASHAEWGHGLHEDGFGLLAADETVSATGFAAWVTRLHDEGGHPDDGARTDAVSGPCIYRWIVEGDRVLGGIALRYGENEDIQRAGHIGYGIRPSARRSGLATWALHEILGYARSLGMERVFLVCEADNKSSVSMIERTGGYLDRTDTTGAQPIRWYSLATT